MAVAYGIYLMSEGSLSSLTVIVQAYAVCYT